MLKSFKERFDAYDKFLMLRAVLALMIIVYHSLPPRQFLVISGFDLTWLFFANGAAAVYGFFILSGYLMGKMYFLGKYNSSLYSIKQFFLGRARRILPLYYFALLIMLLFSYSHLQMPHNWNALASIALFYYNGVPPPVFNNAWWAIAVEVQFYLLVPLIFIAFRKLFIDKKTLIGLLLLLISYSIILRTYFFGDIAKNETVIQILRNPLVQNIDIFLYGFILYPLKEAFLPKYKMGSLAAVPLFFAFYLTTALFWYRESWRGTLENQLYFIFLPLFSALFFTLMILASENKQTIGTDADRISFKQLALKPLKLLEFGGLISFGVFLWHMAILQTMGSLWVYDGRLIIYFIKLGGTVFWSVVLASVTYYLIEKRSK